MSPSIHFMTFTLIHLLLNLAFVANAQETFTVMPITTTSLDDGTGGGGTSSGTSQSTETSTATPAPALTTVTTVVLTTSSGSLGTSTFSTTVTTVVTGNASTTASSTTTAFPSLETYSPCVSQCLQLSTAESQCSMVTDVSCYCNNTNFPTLIMNCILGECPNELGTAEDLAQRFCNLLTPSVSLSFPLSATTTSPTSTSMTTTTSPPSATTSNAASSVLAGISELFGLVISGVLIM